MVRTNKFDAALNDFNKSISLDNSSAALFYNRGTFWLNQKEYIQAIKDFDNAIKLDSFYVKAYSNRGMSFANLKRYEEALADYNTIIKLDEGNARAYSNRGITLTKVGDFENAIQDFNKAISIDSNYRKAFFNRAIVHRKLENYTQALQDYESYLKLLPDDDNYKRKIAIAESEELSEIIANRWLDEINKLVQKIKELLLFDKPCVTHYTSLSAAKSMILDNSLFRLSEGAYLNDTSEGRELFHYLSFTTTKQKEESIEDYFVERPFIGSFVADNKNDDLTLWRMYGKEANIEARGCALTIFKDQFIANLESKLNPLIELEAMPQMEGKFTFYRVAYKNDQEFFIPEAPRTKNRKLNRLLKKLKEQLEVLNEAQKNTVKVILNDIAYLFKSVEYQYEQEVRLVVQGVGFKKIIQKATNPPRVYIKLINIIPILQKITLGPKVERADEWAAAFNYHIKKRKEKKYTHLEREKPVEIIISHLPFK
ncbi:hypothetical protein BC343_08015 [Mucilaginibacter pedocola]|uniref:Uncharacterized protein n=1 Tax=Mucilaginibacter pedocola TaxID=1792845 RepID=A0A1S9PCF5_9SPHI|nr:hypothetical protein BC343_08015 [Mucilaginibacter pedocola]